METSGFSSEYTTKDTDSPHQESISSKLFKDKGEGYMGLSMFH